MSILSIIVPVYNEQKHLKTCIDSILLQNFKGFELIIVNDGSTDGSKEICDEYLRSDSRVIVLHQENLGVSAARNSALKIANGTYIGFIDADDTIDSDMYELLIGQADSLNADIAICGIRRFIANKTSLESGTNQIQVLNTREGLDEFFNEKIPGSVYDKIFRSELVKPLRFEGKHYEDLLFTFFALSKAKKTVFIDTPKYNYLSHEESVSRSKFSKNHVDTILFSKKIAAVANQHLPDHSEQAKALDFVMNISLLNLILLNDKKQYRSEYHMVKETLADYAKSFGFMRSLKMKHQFAYYLFKASEKLYLNMLRLHGEIIGNAATKLS